MPKTLLLLKSIVLMLSMLTFAHACKKTANYTVEGNYNLRAEQTVSLVEGSKNTLTASNFADSRCPINVDCVWEGTASIKVAITIDGKTENLELCKGGCNVTKQATQHEFSINGIDYTIELADLTPYPDLPKTSTEQTAKLLIKKK
ncbi:MAG: hypothetical protein EOO47_10465 [Flavobacterium sp.]|nr:MAG: hypothetical protein EOO47_10465 [Flavobacterium sp.]